MAMTLKQARSYHAAPPTFLGCRVCGYSPTSRDPSNHVVRYWEPDDGWCIGALCIWCADDVAARRPLAKDYAYNLRYHYADTVETDEDASSAPRL